MRVLVTGANGFIGSALVRRLLANGRQVRCLVHNSAGSLSGLGAECIAGDITRPDSLTAIVEGVQTVFHLAGSGRAGDWGARDWFFRLNADGTRNLLEASVQAGVRRFVLVSSLAVHRFSGHVDADEDTPTDQRKYAYGASKVAAEAHLWSAAASGSIEAVAVRPGVVVFGPRDTTAFVHMAPMLARGRWAHVAGGRPLLCYSYVDNLVDGLLLAGDHPAAAGQVFNLTDDLRLSWRDLIDAVFAAFGVSGRTVSFPAPLGRLAGWTAEGLFRLVRSRTPPSLTDYRTALVARDFHFSCERAKRTLGYRPMVGLEEGLRETVAWYRRFREAT
jgi:nucleoside-diphosphate-sugar epimerase